MSQLGWLKKARRIKQQHRKQHRRRTNASRHIAASVASKPHTTVGIEDLNIANLTRSARGTTSHPGRGVAAKTGLNRRLQAASIGRLQIDIDRACQRHSKLCVRVPAHKTSLKGLRG